MKTLPIIRTVGFVSLIILAGAGCQSSSSTAISIPANAVSQAPVVPRAAGIPIPNNFPSDIPRYPGATTIAAAIFGSTATLAQEVGIAPDQAASWISRQFSGMTAQLDAQSQQGRARLFTYGKNGIHYRVRVDDNQDGTSAITISRQAP